MAQRTVAAGRGDAVTMPPAPVWTRVDPWEWAVTSLTAGGTEVTRRVCKTNFEPFGRGRKQWWVIEDGVDPWWLGANIADAKDEFLLAYHGWRRPFGYVDGDWKRPIYGNGQQRRERGDLLVEIKAAYRATRKTATRVTDQTGR